MEIQELSDKDKVIKAKILKDLQENTDKQFKDIRKTIREQSEKPKKEIENMK